MSGLVARVSSVGRFARSLLIVSIIATIQTYTLERVGNKWRRYFGNEAGCPDSGAFELARITLYALAP
jgi:hypothetical protein